jgi:hypothetical protein
LAKEPSRIATQNDCFKCEYGCVFDEVPAIAPEEQQLCVPAVLLVDDRSAVGAGAAPPQKQGCAGPDRGPTSRPQFVSMKKGGLSTGGR